MQKTKKGNTLEKEVLKTKVDKTEKLIDDKATEVVSTEINEVKAAEVKTTAKTKSKKTEKTVASEKKKPATKAKSTATKTKSTTKVKSTSKKESPKQVEQVKMDVLTESTVESVNLYDIIGNCEVKLIPYSGAKDHKKYPINVVLKDLGYVKDLLVRYTTDNWENVEEEPLAFISKEGELEKWGTTLTLNKNDIEKFQYVIQYKVNDWTYWDNNLDNNYTF